MPPDSLIILPDTIEAKIIADSLHVFVENISAVPDTGPGFLSLARDIVLIITAIIGAFVAVSGLWTWRKQLKGKTEYELARRLLKAVYRVREAFRVVRNPFISGGEMHSALRKSGNTEGDLESKLKWGSEADRVETDRVVYNERLRVLGEAFADLDVELLEAEVLWGSEVRDRLKPLLMCRGELVSSLWLYFHLREKKPSDPGDSERWKKVEGVIWEIISDERQDPFAEQIHEAVGKVESLVKPHLKM